MAGLDHYPIIKEIAPDFEEWLARTALRTTGGKTDTDWNGDLKGLC